jgi:hypothetical protein
MKRLDGREEVGSVKQNHKNERALLVIGGLCVPWARVAE